MIWKWPESPTGERRVARRFAFLPTRIDPDLMVWLGSYYEIRIYLFGKWVPCSWKDTGLPATDSRKAIPPKPVRAATLTDANTFLATFRDADVAALKATEAEQAE